MSENDNGNNLWIKLIHKSQRSVYHNNKHDKETDPPKVCDCVSSVTIKRASTKTELHNCVQLYSNLWTLAYCIFIATY